MDEKFTKQNPLSVKVTKTVLVVLRWQQNFLHFSQVSLDPNKFFSINFTGRNKRNEHNEFG